MAQITPPPRPQAGPGDIRIETDGLTPAEAAAVTAVTLAALDEQAEIARVAPPPPSGWELSRRMLRSPLHPGPGAWRASAW
ncbi:acyl-CoA carboxylase subunit epsilon [Agromyces archimandritae]|uniref:Acyl-CoA carboxylase subunit epsilon n=1 Tax=Agromyces archimandritae TaxID=2781962 RepID=A0A975FMQ0_9MICO|nr:acyl-CoA carboxylase subunit epsilon [Agromyces archimandritae]QTX05298.1 acyl-CoA carboxylase subunit epsilon [Agromyces archimandritae]